MRNAIVNCLVSLGLCLLGACGVGHAAESTLPLSATYVVERQGKASAVSTTFEWTLQRTETCVSARDRRANVEDQWRRDEQGRIWYRRIFHDHRKIIEYQPSELSIGHIEDNWRRIASVIDPSDLATLQLQDQSEVFNGQRTFMYAGERQGTRWEVAWLAANQIPARLSVADRNGQYVLKLRQLSSDAAAVCTSSESSSYETIDFADIGDRQGDPFINELMKYEGMRHGH